MRLNLAIGLLLCLWPALALAGTADIANFYVYPNTLTGGYSTRGVVQLASAPSSDVTVALVSPNPFVTVPQSVTLPSGIRGISFPIQTSVVSAVQTVTVTAAEGASSLDTTLVVNPYPIKNFYISPTNTASGSTPRAVIQLAGPAGPGGDSVAIQSDNPIVSPSISISVPQGKTGASFPITTHQVTQSTTVNFTASLGPSSMMASLTVTPSQLINFYVAQLSVIGGVDLHGVIQFNANAPSESLVATLESNSPDVRLPTSITVPQGFSGASFSIATDQVSLFETDTLTATYGSTTLHAQLTLAPAIFKSILAESSRRVVNMEVLGDSITWGQDAADPNTQGFVGILRNTLQTEYGKAGWGFRSVFYSQETGPLSEGYVWSFPQGWSHYVHGQTQKQANIAGTGLGVAFGNDTAAGPAEADVQTVGSEPVSFNLYYGKGAASSQFPGSANVSVKVDGSTLGEIDCSNPGTTNLYGNLATFTHQPTAAEIQQGYFAVQIQPEDSDYAWIEGIDNVTYAGGVKVDQLGLPGVSAGRYAYSDANSLQASTVGLHPDILIVELGINDLYSSNPNNTVQTNAAAIVQYIEDIVKQPSVASIPVVLVGIAQPPSIQQSPKSGTALAGEWPTVIQQLEQLAVKNDFYFLSIFDLWNRSWQWAHNEGYQDLTVHPTILGHAQIASALENLLDSSP